MLLYADEWAFIACSSGAAVLIYQRTKVQWQFSPNPYKLMRALSLLKPSLMPQLKSSCMALLGFAESTPPTLVDRQESIRQLMLSELGEYGEKKFPAVARRIRYAPDVHGLWYARSDVMAILANIHGETDARERVARISSKFKGLLPSSLTKRAGIRTF